MNTLLITSFSAIDSNNLTNLISSTLIEDIEFFISITIFFLGFTLFYFYPAFFIVYVYFAKKKGLQGVKSHLIGGAVTGFSISIFYLIVIPVIGESLIYLIDNFSPFPPSPNLVWSNVPFDPYSLEYLTFYLILLVVNMIIASGITTAAYELIPKIRRFFRKARMIH